MTTQQLPHGRTEVTVQKLVDEKILDKPIDGNHGGIHPKSEDFVPVGVPFIMASDLSNGKICYDTCKFISAEQNATLQKGFAKPGDVLLSHKATIGRTAIVDDKFTSITLTPQVTYYRVFDESKMNNKYLYYYFNSPFFQNTFNSRAGSGSTRAYLGITDQRKFPILLPPLPEQQAIASMLSAFDDKIELLREENKTLEALGQTIFKEWFGKYKMDKFIKAKDILEFEKGIEVGSKNYSEEKETLNHPIRFFRVGDIFQNGNYSKTFTEKELLKNKTFEKNDILVSFDGTVGRVFIGGDGGYSSGIRKIYSKSGQIKNSFLYFWVKSEEVQKTINLYSEGTTIQHAGKSIEHLKIISDQKYIDEITETLNPIFRKILDNLYQIQSLSTSRDTLLPKLMSGEVRVEF